LDLPNPVNPLTHTAAGLSVGCAVGAMVEGEVLIGEITIDESALTVVLHGDLDMVTVDDLRTMLDDDAAGPAPTVVVDLTDVAFLDVMSLSVILGTVDALRETGRELTVRGASASVRRVCALLNADDVLEPAPMVDAFASRRVTDRT
jgi:anti-anti-sigma factor